MSGGVLLQIHNEWRIAVAGSSVWHTLAQAEPWDPEELVDQLEQAFEQLNLAEKQLFVACDSRHALSATFEMEAEDAKSRMLLAYELESFLPWSAEETVSDFIVQDGQAMGVGIWSEQWLPLIRLLETRGFRVSSITPYALAGMQHCEREEWWQHADGVVWVETDVAHVVRLQSHRPLRWRLVSNHPNSILTEVASQTTDGKPARWIIVNEPPHSPAPIESLPNVEVERVTTDTLEDHASQLAAGALAGQESLWFELRRGNLALGSPWRAVQRPLAALAASACLFILTWFAVFGFLTLRNRHLVREAYAEQEQVFRQALPNANVPAAVLSRLRSEHARRAAARRGPKHLQLPLPALGVLRDFLEGLPANQRIYVRELRIENGNLDLVADVPTHAAANALAESLRRQGFQVPPPATVQNDDHTVSVRLFAKWQDHRKTAQAEGKSP